ncbi:MAG: hypothetical protein MUE46_02240 [Xanthomonadales bacterium]|nr:hypothetical protein [Xanthomonadales bacterium]
MIVSIRTAFVAVPIGCLIASWGASLLLFDGKLSLQVIPGLWMMASMVGFPLAFYPELLMHWKTTAGALQIVVFPAPPEPQPGPSPEAASVGQGPLSVGSSPLACRSTEAVALSDAARPASATH